MKLISIAAATLVTIAFPAFAQDGPGPQHGGGGAMQNSSPPMQNMTDVQREYHSVMQKMNREMMQGMMDKDPGHSWLKQMIAHHQGAIEMSEIAIKHSKDDDVIRSARKTSEQNEKDKKELQAKLRKEQR